jgi:hypothetical protein
VALINCPECEARVSDAAPACIKCGYPFARPLATHADQSTTTPAPRCDGIYVTPKVKKERGALGFLRTGYLRGYIRFFQDGLMLYAGAVVVETPGPGPFPQMYRASKFADDDRAFRWAMSGPRVRVTSSGGFVGYADLDGSRLTWDWTGDPEAGVFVFHEFVWPDQ